MKLYFMPGACSLSPHIVFREAGLKVDIEKVNTQEQRTESGQDFRAINPKGYVPALQLDDGEVLTESGVIAQFLADQAPNAKLIPAAGTRERYRMMEWMNFISTELHKNFTTLFSSKMPAEAKQTTTETLFTRFGLLEKHLAGKDFVMGSQFTVADAYLFTVVNWANFLKIDISQFPALVAHNKRVGGRPAVQEALRAYGLMK